MVITGMTLNQVIDTLDEMRLRLDGQVPQGADKEEFSILNSDGGEVGQLFVNKFDKIELYGPRLLRERMCEVAA